MQTLSKRLQIIDDSETTMSKILFPFISFFLSASYAGVDPLRVLESENSFTNFIAIAVIVLVIIFGVFGSK